MNRTMMDRNWYPKRCLTMAREYLDGGDTGVATMQLVHYRRWRYGYGPEPTMDDGTGGDQFAKDLCVRLGYECLDQIPDLIGM